jgi:hypothetical protein
MYQRTSHVLKTCVEEPIHPVTMGIHLRNRASGTAVMVSSLASLLCVSSCNDAAPSTPTVTLTVGAMLPRTGPNASSDWVAAAELALLDMNTGLRTAKMDKPVTFAPLEKDTASDEATAFAFMDECVQAGAKVVVTESTSAAIGANEYNYTATTLTPLPVISFSATSAALNNPATTDPDPARQAGQQDLNNWFFRTCQISNNLSPLRYRYAFSQGPTGNGDLNGDGIVKIVWVGNNAASTVSSIAGDQKSFLAAFTALGRDPATYASESITFDLGTTTPDTFNYNDYIAQAVDNLNATTGVAVQDGFPDLIYDKTLPTIAPAFARAYAQTGNTIPVFEDGSFRRNTTLTALGTMANGHVGVSNIAFEHNASGELFAQEQAKANGTGYPPGAYEAQAYDAMAMALLATVQATITAGDPASVTPAQVRDALTLINSKDPAAVLVGTGAKEFKKGVEAMVAGKPIDYEGASGHVDFDAVGNVTSRAVLFQVQNGQFVETAIYDCTQDSTCPLVQ